jgi:chromosome segregation ATPase
MVKPLDLQVFARVEQIAGNLQLEQVQRTNAEDALSNRLDGTSAQLDARVDAIAHDVQQERDARTAANDALSQRLDGTNAALDAQAARLDAVAGDLQRERDARTAADDALSKRLDDVRSEIDGQLLAIHHEIEELEDLIGYLEYCAFAEHSPFHELLHRIGITTVEQLRGREPEELHREIRRIAEQEPHYRAVPAVRRRRVTDEIIQWSRAPRAPSSDDGRPEGDRSASPGRRRSGGRGTQTD